MGRLCLPKGAEALGHIRAHTGPIFPFVGECSAIVHIELLAYESLLRAKCVPGIGDNLQ